VNRCPRDGIAAGSQAADRLSGKSVRLCRRQRRQASKPDKSLKSRSAFFSSMIPGNGRYACDAAVYDRRRGCRPCRAKCFLILSTPWTIDGTRGTASQYIHPVYDAAVDGRAETPVEGKISSGRSDGLELFSISGVAMDCAACAKNRGPRA